MLKTPEVAKCSKCGEEFKVRYAYAQELICDQCIEQLPKCYACGMMIAPGYYETSLINIGKYHICGSCYGELLGKDFLHIQCADDQRKGLFLLPDGTVKEFALEQEKEFFASGMSIKEFLETESPISPKELEQRREGLKEARHV